MSWPIYDAKKQNNCLGLFTTPKRPFGCTVESTSTQCRDVTCGEELADFSMKPFGLRFYFREWAAVVTCPSLYKPHTHTHTHTYIYICWSEQSLLKFINRLHFPGWFRCQSVGKEGNVVHPFNKPSRRTRLVHVSQSTSLSQHRADSQKI